MGNYGIKITKTGYDVSTATLLQQIFNSEKNCLKIALEGDISSTASGLRTVQVAHGLSVTPAYLVFFEVDNNGKWYPNFTNEDASGKGGYTEAYTDATYLQIPIYSSSSATIKIHYVIFVDPGQ